MVTQSQVLIGIVIFFAVCGVVMLIESLKKRSSRRPQSTDRYEHDERTLGTEMARVRRMMQH